jgi:tricarballylate dehydrogenase
MISGEFDVVVVGAGNAGMCAALAARGEGARVLVLEEGLFEERRIQIAYEAKDERLIADGDGVHGV